MEPPLPLTLVLINLILAAAGFILFLPEGFRAPGLSEIGRLLRKYHRHLVAALLVLGVHLLLVQIDPALAGWLDQDHADLFNAVEDGLVPALAEATPTTLAWVLSTVVVIVHPWMLYFAPLLYVLTDEERAARGSLLLYPLAYAFAVPFFLFFPVTPVYAVHEIASPLFDQWPQLSDLYLAITATDNNFPSLQVAIALLLANAARYSRNRNFRYFTFAYAALSVLAPLLLGLQWALGVAGGLLVAGAVTTLTNRVLDVERLALQRIKPTPEEAQRIRDVGDELVQVVGETARRLHVPADPMLVGSVAKNTYLAQKVDFDVFLLLPPDTEREQLQTWGLQIGRAILPEGEEKYAEHPYIHGEYKGWDADLVPAYKISDPSQKMSAVDRTPFHTRFILDHMTREQQDQTRLLKQFMVGTRTYGAEAQTQGFSGYLCELLILKFGTFRGVIRNGAHWKPGAFFCLEQLEGNPEFNDPLVFLDPVDPARNAASAVSAETLQRFSEACRDFQQREGLTYFFPRQLVPLTPEDLERVLRRRRTDLLLLEFEKPQDVLEDHLYAQMRKADTAIQNLLERHEFEPRATTWRIGDTHIRHVIEVTRLRIPEGQVHSGPPVKEKDHAARFRKSWTDNPDALGPVYEENGRLKVKRKREYRRADELLRNELPQLHLGKHVSRSVRRDFDLHVNRDAIREDTTTILTQHLTRKQPWEL